MHARDSLPAAFLSREICPPAQLLTLPLRPHTQNVLHRFLSAWSSTGNWTYRRLLAIPGFGLSALADLLETQSGQRAGATRSRVDRRAPRSRRSLRPEGIWRAREVIGNSLPASEREIHDRLLAAGLGPAPPTLADVERAARFLGAPAPFAVLRRPGLVLAVSPQQLPLAATVHTLALRLVRTFGLGAVQRIAFGAGTKDLAFVRAVVSARRGFRWVDRDHDRFDYLLDAR